jgi:hypothetical protein
MAGVRGTGAATPALPVPATPPARPRGIHSRSLCYAPRQRVRAWSLP